MFISPNLRSQNYLHKNQTISNDSHETSFDEIENLRAEVKRLSDIVTDQTDLLSYIHKNFCQVIRQTKPFHRFFSINKAIEKKVGVVYPQSKRAIVHFEYHYFFTLEE